VARSPRPFTHTPLHTATAKRTPRPSPLLNHLLPCPPLSPFSLVEIEPCPSLNLPRTRPPHPTPSSLQVEIEAFAQGEDLKQTLTRAKFEDLNASAFNSCVDTVKKVGSNFTGGGAKPKCAAWLKQNMLPS
jgi:hypothetical protein